MNRLSHAMLAQEATEDTTSAGFYRLHRAISPSATRHRAFQEQYVLLAMVTEYGRLLGTPEEMDSLLGRFQEIASNVTTWEVHEQALAGLDGVVALQRKRREIFRIKIDISPGSLPRRKARFAFLDQDGSRDDD